MKIEVDIIIVRAYCYTNATWNTEDSKLFRDTFLPFYFLHIWLLAHKRLRRRKIIIPSLYVCRETTLSHVRKLNGLTKEREREREREASGSGERDIDYLRIR